MTDPSKYVTLPVKHEKIWRKYQKTLDSFWTVYDVYLQADRSDMQKLTQDQQDFICKTLAFMYIAHHTALNKELFMELMEYADIKEASYYFGSQADAKKTHSVMYSMLLDELLDNDNERKNKLMSDVASIPEVRNALKWFMVNLNNESFVKRLLTLATLQGIVFEVPFTMFSWIQKRFPSVMPGLSKSNTQIWTDERLNLSFSCMLFDYIEDELDQDEARAIVKDAVFHTKNLFTKAIPVLSIGMENELVEQYIEHSADKILTDIHLGELYQKESPFDWVIEVETESNAPTVGLTAANYGAANFETDTDF